MIPYRTLKVKDWVHVMALPKVCPNRYRRFDRCSLLSCLRFLCKSPHGGQSPFVRLCFSAAPVHRRNTAVSFRVSLTRSEIIQPGIQSKMALVIPMRVGLQGLLSSAVPRPDESLNCSSLGTSKTS